MEWLDSLNKKQRAAADKVARAAEKYNVPRELALAAAMQESTFDQRKKSGTGPVGVMMMGRAASKQYGINPHNEDQNIEGGVRYLGDLLKKHGGDPQKALIAYHDGPNSSYFKGGQMSPAAYNHLQKVQSYGGFQGELPPMAKNNEVPFKIAEVDPIEDISFPGNEDIEFFARPRDIVDYGAGAAGALAGATLGANKPLSVNKQRLELGKQRMAQMQLNQAQAGMPPTAKTFGQDIGNWVPGQYREDIARNIQSPMSQEDAAAQARALEAKANVANAKFGPSQPARPGSPIVIPGNMPQFPGTAVTAPPPMAQPTLAEMPASKIGAGRNVAGRVMNTGTGALAGMQAADAYQRGMQGDTAGAALSGISSAGLAGATHIPHRKAQLAAGVVGAGAGLLGQGYDYLRDKFDIKRKPESVLEKAAGGLTALPKFAGRGESLVKLGKAALDKGDEMIGRSPRTVVQAPAWTHAKDVGKMSDWAQNYLNQYITPTQADRMGGVGGPSYSANSLMYPRYAGRVWGSGERGTATGITNLAKDPKFGGTRNQIFAPLLGKETMHQSNQIAYDALKDAFYKEHLPPELREKINAFMQAGGPSGGGKLRFEPIPGFDIADKSMMEELGKTFDMRKAIAAHAFGGEGIGARGAQIIPHRQILDAMADPLTQGAPSFSIGPRAFRLSGDVEAAPRPDLNLAYPYQLHGEDLGVAYNPVPSELALRDFQQQWRKDTGKETARPSGKIHQPGYYEHTLGYTPPGSDQRIYPRQQITEEWIKELQRSGYDKGGVIKPIVDRINMHFKDVTKRIPQLQEGAQKMQGGEMTREAYEQLVNTHKPVTPFAFIPKPATREEAMNALTSDKKDLFGVPSQTLPAGHPVGLRLDIPAYSNHGVWVPTVHEQASGFGAGKAIGHESVAHVLNPQFGMSDKAALSIAAGKPKGTIATIKGNWNPTDEQAAVAKAQEYLNHPEWRQVGMDPERHGYFYDRATMEPITHAEEALQIGPLVLAKKPKYGKKEDFKFAKGGLTHLK
jgi:hypothetical protein